MSRRSTPQQKTDDAAFPVRIRVKVSETGFGQALDHATRWLNDHVGRGNYAWHAGSTAMTGDAAAVHFRSVEAARAFMSAFPSFELADGTTSRIYTAPGR